MKKFVDNYIIILLKSYTKRTQLPNLKDADTLFHWCEQPCDYQNLAKRPMKTKSVLYAMANGVINKKKIKKIKPPRPGNLINCSWSICVEQVLKNLDYWECRTSLKQKQLLLTCFQQKLIPSAGPTLTLLPRLA